MRYANPEKFHKALCKTYQIKGQYEPLCLNILNQGWAPGSTSYTYMWARCGFCGWHWWILLMSQEVRIIMLTVCYLNVLKFLFTTHPPPLTLLRTNHSLKVSWEYCRPTAPSLLFKLVNLAFPIKSLPESRPGPHLGFRVLSEFRNIQDQGVCSVN